MLTRKFGRTIDHRQSLLRNMATSLFLYERVVTTTAKAKEVRGLAERLINTGKEGGLANYRYLRGILFDPKAAKKVIEELGPRYKNVTGGYVVLHALGRRQGDAAPMSLMELRSVRESERSTEVKKETPKKSTLKKTTKKTVAAKKARKK